MINKNKYIFGDKAVDKLAYELAMANCVKCGVLISKSDSTRSKLNLIKNALSNIEYEILIDEKSDIQNIAKKAIEKTINALVILGNHELINKGSAIQKIIKESNRESLPTVLIISGSIKGNLLKNSGSQRTVIICDDRLINTKNRVEITNNAIDTLYTILVDCNDNCSYIAIPSHIVVFNKIINCLANGKNKTLNKSQLIDLNRAIIESNIGLSMNTCLLNNEHCKSEDYALTAQQMILRNPLSKSMELFISHLECSKNALLNEIKTNETVCKLEEIINRIEKLRKK